MSDSQDNMNPYIIRDNLRRKKGQRVKVRINGMRNKTTNYIGIIQDIYPQIFTIYDGNKIFSYSFSELISGEVELHFI